MISSLKNGNGFIYAYIEWEILDAFGQFKDFGEYIYIQNLWVHENFQNSRAIKELIGLIDSHPFAKNSDYVYWNNLKHNDRLTKPFRRERLAKMGVKHGQKNVES